MEPENARLKRLLDKKRRALAMPKSKLGELEDEYAELLSRIDAERERLGIDATSVERFISETAQRYSAARAHLDRSKLLRQQLNRVQDYLRKSAENGDADDYRYYQKQLVNIWERILADARKNSQVSLFEIMEEDDESERMQYTEIYS